jgi:hypothetical protein
VSAAATPPTVVLVSDERRDRWRRLLGGALFPLIIVSASLNQERPYLLTMMLGQITSVACVLTAIVLPILAFPTRQWPSWLAMAVILCRLGRAALGVELIATAYTVLLAVALVASAIAIAAEQPARLRRQMVTFMAWSAVLMLLQLLGVSPWTQVLRTDFHAFGEESLVQYDTLFVPIGQVIPTVQQIRPAGFMASNNLFSVFVVGALAFCFGAPTVGRLRWSHIVLTVACVLTAAKIALLVYVVMVVSQLVFGAWRRRWLAVKLGVLFYLTMQAYIYFFPGVFDVVLTPDVWLRNFQYRLVDFLLATNRPELMDLVWVWQLPVETVKSDAGTFGGQSGYGFLAPWLPWIVVGGFAMIPLLLTAWRRLRAHRSQWLPSGLLTMQAVVLVPLISPFFETNIFPFLLGLAVLPIVTALGFGRSPLFDSSDIERPDRRVRHA